MSAARRAGSVPTAVRAAARDRVGVVSLGCPKNLVDTEIMLGELERRGYRIVADAGAADTVIVNTCAVTAASDTRALVAASKTAATR